jgi:two-component system LytT family response regulator
MISCIIVDDEQHAIDILEYYVKQTPQLNLLASFLNPIDALQFVSEEKVDLLFLDIHMPEISGLDFIKAIHGKSKVILTTAYSEFALEGYELYVVDYLMKPIRLPRFLAAVQKAGDQLQLKSTAGHESSGEMDYIFVKTEAKGKYLKIDLADIDYIESSKNYVVIHRGAQKTMVYTSMKELEDKLPARQFMRVHKSFIVPVSRITGVEGNLLRLKNIQAEIIIGDSYKEPVMEMIRSRMIR